MKKFLAILLLGFSSVYAQTVTAETTTPNLITSGTNHTWTGVNTGTLPGNYMPGGPTPLYDPAANSITFSYGSPRTVAQTIAINNALANVGAGVQINGYNYSYDVRNMNGDNRQGGTDTFSITTKMTSNTGNTLLSSTENYNTKFEWTSYSNSKTANTPYTLDQLGNLVFSVTGADNGYWGGYFGPQVRNVNMSLRYSAAPAIDPCTVNPLSSPSCSGYQAAYELQMCSSNPLFSSTCPGYAQALLTQQCSANQLSSPSCPGYAAMYLTQQCSANPLYSNRCTGYSTAYHDQQCSANPLYATDCAGYASAYLNQQCAANPLYSTTCSGYARAYLNQQCLADSLYSTQCEGYKTAYAIKYLVGMSPTVTSAVNQQLTNTVETQRNDPTNVTGTVDAVATVSGTSASTQATATTSATSISPVAVISTVRPAPAPMTTMAQAEPKKDEPKKDGGNTSSGPSGDSKPSNQPKSNREALQERRAEAAKKEAVAKGANLANEMGKAADMESQKAIQNVVIQAMGFTPGFDTYNTTIIPDTTFYKPFTVYGNQKNVDNQNVGRRLMGGSDRLHQDMVDSQYNIGN